VDSSIRKEALSLRPVRGATSHLISSAANLLIPHVISPTSVRKFSPLDDYRKCETSAAHRQSRRRPRGLASYIVRLGQSAETKILWRICQVLPTDIKTGT
jgi:hypothetical protein